MRINNNNKIVTVIGKGYLQIIFLLFFVLPLSPLDHRFCNSCNKCLLIIYSVPELRHKTTHSQNEDKMIRLQFCWKCVWVTDRTKHETRLRHLSKERTFFC